MAEAEELARIAASPGRRAFGLGVLIVLGVILFWLAFGPGEASLGWRALVAVAAAGVVWAAREMRRATALALVLTREALRDSSGTVLARVADIESVDRGTFAFKPSNGFLLRTRAAQDRLWRPGLYWRLGRRIGVGGVAHAAEARAMADAITVLLVEARAAAPDTPDGTG